MLARIFSISSLVNACDVCARILPRVSVDSKTLAAVSAFGLEDTYLVVVTECSIHLLDGDSL